MTRWSNVSESSGNIQQLLILIRTNINQIIVQYESDLVQTSKEGLAAIFESYRLSGGNRE